MSERSPHPAGLRTLFFTEMWERFSFYGMRALLVLFLVDQTRGGFALDEKVATAIYGLYTAGVYFGALPGGWIADRILGPQRAVWWGGIIIAAGHFVMALHTPTAFYLGLCLVVVGTGLLKPNISVMVGDLYRENQAARDAGFTIFYMGINLGAAIGPLVCGYLATRFSWSVGFAISGVAMLLGLIPFGLATRRGEVFRAAPPQKDSKARTWFGAGVATVVTALTLAFAGVIPVEPVAFAHGTKYFLVSLAAVFFAGVYLFGRLNKEEKGGVLMIGVLFIASAIFWAGFEQMGSSFNLFAERFTDRTIFGFEFPAAWFQSVGPIFIIALSPLVASVWLRLGKRGADPGIAGKFGMGLLFLAAGFVVMSAGAQLVGKMGVVGPSWLICTYLLHTIGELCVSPVGLSSISGLAPRRFVSQMMGVWFLATALGNVLAGLMAGSLALDEPGALSGGFLQIAVLPAISGGALLVLALVWGRVQAAKGRTQNQV